MRAVLLTALATAVLLTGCGSDEPEDDKPVLGMEAPTPSGPPTEAPKPTAKPTPKPPARPKVLGKTLPVKILGPGPPVLETEAQSKSTGSVTSQILEAMRLRTDLMAGYKGATGGRCDRGRVRLAANATTNCSVSYRGHPVRWSVTISDDYKSGNVFIQYQIYPQRAVLLSKAVYSEWWATNKTGDHLGLRCSKVPPLTVVTPDAPTIYKCQKLMPGVDSEPPYWQDSRISVGDYGVEFD